MKADWHLRLARPEDAPHMPPIEARAGKLFGQIEGLAGIVGQQTVPVERLQRYIRKGHCLVAHVGGAMAGWLVNEPFGRELHIWEFNVDPAFQRGGVGSGLLRACLTDATNSGFKAVTLTTFRDVAWNAPFYARLGFEVVEDAALSDMLRRQLTYEVSRGLHGRCAMRLWLRDSS